MYNLNDGKNNFDFYSEFYVIVVNNVDIAKIILQAVIFGHVRVSSFFMGVVYYTTHIPVSHMT